MQVGIQKQQMPELGWPVFAYSSYLILSHFCPDTLAFKSHTWPVLLHSLSLEHVLPFLLSHNGMILVCSHMWLAAWCAHQHNAAPLLAWILRSGWSFGSPQGDLALHSLQRIGGYLIHEWHVAAVMSNFFVGRKNKAEGRTIFFHWFSDGVDLGLAQPTCQ